MSQSLKYDIVFPFLLVIHFDQEGTVLDLYNYESSSHTSLLAEAT